MMKLVKATEAPFPTKTAAPEPVLCTKTKKIRLRIAIDCINGETIEVNQTTSGLST
jgi:hypothetical protein